MTDENQELWSNFLGSLKSPATKRQYESIVKSFMKFNGFSEVKQMMGMERKELQQKIINYTLAKKNNGDSAHTCNVHLSALRHFYIHNDVTDINWVKLRAYSGEHMKTVEDRAYSLEEIRKMMEFSDLRGKCILLLFASTGMRIGALPDLKMKHITPVETFYKIKVYQGSKEAYTTYCTPECRAHLDKYFEYRRRSGEELNPESPLIREQFDANDTLTINKPKPLAKFTIAALMRNLAIKTGIRTPTDDKQKRQEVMLMHGLRKFYNTQMINAEVKPLIKEMLIGHKTMGLESSYYRPTEQDIQQEYVKAIDHLTIFTENKLRAEVKELQSKLSMESKLRDELKKEIQKEFEKKMEEMDNRIEEAMAARGG